jgi:Tat protein translocase TatB subunit
MELFGISMWELLLILVVALIVLGPNKLPRIARSLGKTIRAIRKASSDITVAITRELDASEEESSQLKERSHKPPSLPEQKKPPAAEIPETKGEGRPG